jgi:RNase H-fold protein (predicted Holliday junction resolvase)
MAYNDVILSEYKDVIVRLKENMESDPAGTAKIISSYINLITYAFDKPYQVIDELVQSTEYDSLNEEEIKILELYFALLQKRMMK